MNELRIGGAEQQLLELVRGLDKSKFHPIVAPLYAGGTLTNEFKYVPGVDVIELNRRGKFDPSPLWAITQILRRYRVDIVQPFLSPATFFGLLPALVVGTPVSIVTERCGVRRSRGLGYKTYRITEDLLSRVADAIVPNSVAGENMLLERGLPAKKIRVIYNGINEDRLSADPERVAEIRAALAVPPGGAAVGILASLTAAKGHDTLLHALSLLRDRHPSIRLAIVGDGPERHRLEALTTNLGISEHVVFFGYQRNVADFLSAFDILVSASRDNEGCSNSILEAMALGIPVVATDIGGNREFVRDADTGYLSAPNDSHSLAHAITRILLDRGAAAAIADNARRMIEEHFSLRRMVAEYELLYEQLTNQCAASVMDADGVVVYHHDHPSIKSIH